MLKQGKKSRGKKAPKIKVKRYSYFHTQFLFFFSRVNHSSPLPGSQSFKSERTANLFPERVFRNATDGPQMRVGRNISNVRLGGAARVLSGGLFGGPLLTQTAGQITRHFGHSGEGDGARIHKVIYCMYLTRDNNTFILHFCTFISSFCDFFFISLLCRAVRILVLGPKRSGYFAGQEY